MIIRVLRLVKSTLMIAVQLPWTGISVFCPRMKSQAFELRDLLNPGFYAAWAAAQDPGAAHLREQSQEARELPRRPLFSIITPVFNPPPEVFDGLIRSIQKQSYPWWELCLANGSTDPAVSDLIVSWKAQDSRIRSVSMDNLGISGNSNEALKLAAGEFIVLVDHDDLVAPHLLFEAAAVLNQEPSLDLLYYDEDMINLADRRCRPFFKPSSFHAAWLRKANYLTHCVLRREMVLNAGGFDPALDGAQDWDLFFRCIEKTDRIAHIPKILYHWRMAPGSAALGLGEKPYAVQAQKRAISNHLGRLRSNS